MVYRFKTSMHMFKYIHCTRTHATWTIAYSYDNNNVLYVSIMPLWMIHLFSNITKFPYGMIVDATDDHHLSVEWVILLPEMTLSLFDIMMPRLNGITISRVMYYYRSSRELNVVYICMCVCTTSSPGENANPRQV